LLAAIPSRSNFDGLSSVVDHCFADESVDKVVVYDNGYTDPYEIAAISDWNVHIDAVGWPFYRMWNNAWSTACKQGFDAVAMLNDDITLHPHSLDVASRVLQENHNLGIVGLNYMRPVDNGVDYSLGFRQVHGSYRREGIGGHAFLVRASTWGEVLPIDERYALWYGDDELFFNMENCGYGLAIALGAPVDHATSTTSVQFPDLLARTGNDRALFESKFGAL
jgi:hypothetical protein